MTVFDDLALINVGCAEALCTVSSIPNKPAADAPRLVFPKRSYSPQKSRISEQEVRILWCETVPAPYCYGVEVPTLEKYRQNGKRDGSCARTDAALFDVTKDMKRVANVEFKEGQPTPRNIRKDLEKLVREQLAGNWFHILPANRAKSIRDLSKKFVKALTAKEDGQFQLVNNWFDDYELEIEFAIFVIAGHHERGSRGFLLSNRLLYKREQRSHFEEIVDDFFSEPDERWIRHEIR
ncbi:hypothetical protein GC176_18705 [bacterium]|nr:hypothetical protein [bacterium]